MNWVIGAGAENGDDDGRVAARLFPAVESLSFRNGETMGGEFPEERPWTPGCRASQPWRACELSRRSVRRTGC